MIVRMKNNHPADITCKLGARKNLRPVYLLLAFVFCGAVTFLACGSGATIKGTAVVTTIAGTVGLSGTTDGPGAKALFGNPEGLATDGTSLYVADTYNHTIRKIVLATNEVTTIAGVAGAPGFKDGTGAEAQFNMPYGVATDGVNLYVSDSHNHTIRQIALSTGAVTTIAGNAGAAGYKDAAGAQARFNYPCGIALYGGTLFIADSSNDTIRQMVLSTGSVTTLAGNVGGGSNNGTGAKAGFLYPYGVATDGVNVYVADCVNNVIRQIVISSGVVTTLAGTAGLAGSQDGTGILAQFNHPRGLTVRGGKVYALDTLDNSIREIVISTGVVNIYAGGGMGASDGVGTGAQFLYPYGITTDGTDLYVADTNNDTIRKIH
jgi:hypothetical protein